MSSNPPSDTGADAGTLPATRQTAAPGPALRQDWSGSPDVPTLHGRMAELGTLARWLLADRCRLVAVLGSGGIGKTTLAARLARDLAPQFDAVFWSSLRNAPPVEAWLAGAIGALAAQQPVLPDGAEARLSLLLEVLRAKHCLLILDNFETLLQPGQVEGCYRPEYTGYSLLLRRLAETAHQSGTVVTSRETPPEMGPPDGARFPGRQFRLTGMGVEDAQALLREKRLIGVETAWHALVERYGGNPQALTVVGEAIAGGFSGDIAAFLAHGEVVPEGVRQLLDGQLDRLSAVERCLCYWLAVEREPVSFTELITDLGSVITRSDAQDGLEALRRRSLLERGEWGATFTLQPMVLAHVTDRLTA